MKTWIQKKIKRENSERKKLAQDSVLNSQLSDNTLSYVDVSVTQPNCL